MIAIAPRALRGPVECVSFTVAVFGGLPAKLARCWVVTPGHFKGVVVKVGMALGA
jgi:hypothetical protein